MIDLHIHTNKSDGQFSPKEIVRMAKKRNIDIISITDHDTCEGIKEAIKEGEEIGVKVIPGIELTTFEEEEIHVLGYNINYKSFLLKIYKNRLKKRLKKEERTIFRTFKKMGINIKRKNVKKYAEGQFIEPGDFVQWLIANGYETNSKEAFIKYFIEGELKNRKRGRMNIKDAIELIRLLGGIPVLAHPCRISYADLELENKLKELKEYGLEGIEVFYSMANDSQIKLYKKLAKKYNLLMTLGSDYHGPMVKDYIDMGRGENNSLEKYQRKFKLNELLYN